MRANAMAVQRYAALKEKLGFSTDLVKRGEHADLGFGFGLPLIGVVLLAILFFALTIPISAVLADRWGRRRTLVWTTIAIGAFGFVLAPGLMSGTAATLVTMAGGLALMGFTYGPLGTALSELFPTAVRYTGSSPLPDTFVDNSQALADGRYTRDGVFEASQIQAKCASKYEAAPGKPGQKPVYGSNSKASM